MFSASILCLLVAQACQARHVHVQDLRSIDSRKLFEEGNAGRSKLNMYSPLPAILQQCLADAACSDALAAAAEARQQQQQGGQQRPDDSVGFLAPTASTQLQQKQQQKQQADRMGFAAVGRSSAGGGGGGGGGFSQGGDSLGSIRGPEGGMRSGGWNEGSGGSGGGGGMVIITPLGGDDDSGGQEDERGNEQTTSLSLKGLAALVLFLEAVAGMYLPLLLQRLQSPQWWLSLLNCFSGGIFLSAGIIHLLPHCAEAQEALGPIGPSGGDYPLYLVLVVVGYCVVFYVERVLFDVHGEGHAHCQHSNVYSHSSYYKAISHRSQRISGTLSGTARAPIAAGPEPEQLPMPATAAAAAAGGHASRAMEAAGCSSEATVCALSRSRYKLDCDAAWTGVRATADEPLVPLDDSNDHDHGDGHQQPTHQRVCNNSTSRSGQHPGARLVLLPLPPAAEALREEEGVGPVVSAGVVGNGDDGNCDDAESCHSEHPPRAVCACVEESEAEAELRGQQHHHQHHHNHNHTHGHTHGHHTHQHHQQQQQQQQHSQRIRGDRQQLNYLAIQGQGSTGGCGALAAGSCGGDGDAQFRTPLLLADHAASAQPPMREDASGDAADSGDGDLRTRALAWQLDLQPQLLPLPLPSCAYHPHHHPHPHHHHHRSRRRSAGPGPLLGGSYGSPASSCISLAQHYTDLHPLTAAAAAGHHTLYADTHHANHQHHHVHHHVIKPRFRFMHGVVLLVALALHTALECIALGLIDSRPGFLMLFAAIASHKAVSALALSSRFLREGATLAQVTAYVGPFCLVAPVSILVGVYVGRVAPIARLVFSCFATGTFLYVGASEVIMEEFEGEMRADRRDISTRAARYMKFFAVLAAVALVAASGLLPEPDHH